MKVLAFGPCEKYIKRIGGAVDILGFGMKRIEIKTNNVDEISTAVINFHCLVEFSPGEQGQKHMHICFIDQDGNILSTSPSFKFNIPAKQSTLNLGGEFPLKAKTSGQHSIQLFIDSRQEAEWPIFITIKNIQEDKK